MLSLVQFSCLSLVALSAFKLNSAKLQSIAKDEILNRQKRYLAFPEGSSVSAAVCLTIGMIGNPDVDYLSWAVNWGVAYDLPNHEWVIQHAHGVNASLPKYVIQRRSRRSFYDEVQSAFDHMGFNGKSCVARALCESAKYLTPSPNERKRGNMLEELVRTVFSLPSKHVANHEPQLHFYYDGIYRRSKRATEKRNCHEIYPECNFSLLSLALAAGEMSTKVTSFDFM
ncbi:uncharacterized protein Dwil_GK22340 [Drosophila willistoni]|uniref:Uncharacterized protein n=1 Tax=Drosophila willistoni TaxID=7260 RepID=B4NF16_DROWI|nr:uncharacterized protein LOC6649557 [Drosophila willistoni]EDW83391.1 uncharacterized protein Dwil_GK22340 [Drosophila willistoni]